MEEIKNKILVGVAITGVLLVVGLVFWLLFYQSSIYYTKIDNEKITIVKDSDMKYQYDLVAYDAKGHKKDVTFKTRKELKDGAFLQLDVMITRGVIAWEEVDYNSLPKETQAKYD